MIKMMIVLWISICAVSLLSSCSPVGSPGNSASAAATDLPPVKADTRIIAEGVVLPRQYAALSMLASGTVAAVLVNEGDIVAEGRPLIRLENRSQRAAVSEAEAAVRAAEARLQELKAGPREQEIEAARARLDGAKARLGRLLEDPRRSDLAAAQAAVDEARAALDDLLDGPSADKIAEAAARRANAAAALQQAQAAYDKIKWFDGAGLLPESLQLQQATNDYEAANATYESVRKGATEAEIAAAQARVRKAEAESEKVRQSARASEIAEAEAEIRRNQADLDLLQAGTRVEQITKAEADVVAAYATLRRVQAALGDTELRAPFAGTVAWLNIRPGERVDAGRVVIQLADLSSWVIETDDLTEIEVVDVQIGAPAMITFDAIPGLRLPGRVKWITPFGEKKEGDITYTARICPDEEDPRLRWNMTAIVSIEPLEEPLEGFAQESPRPDTPTPAIWPTSLALPEEETMQPSIPSGRAAEPATQEPTPERMTAPAFTPAPTSTLAPALRPAETATPALPSPTPPAAPTRISSSAASTLSPTGPTVAILSSRLNVRGGPNTSFPIVGYLNAGQELPVLQRDPASGWLQVPFPGAPDEKGWITDREPYVNIKGL